MTEADPNEKRTAPEENTLILRSPTHVVIRIVRKLEYVGWKRDLGGGRVAVLSGILLQNGVGIAGDIFVRIDGDDGGGANVSVYGVGHEPFADACYDDVV